MIGIAPIPSRLQRAVQTVYTTIPKNWRGRQVTLLHKTVLETAALLVGHVREDVLVTLPRSSGYNWMTGTTPLKVDARVGFPPT